MELQDYASVKGLLAQAERMNITGEEVKQAQAMRLRIEVSRPALAGTTNKTIVERHVSDTWKCGNFSFIFTHPPED